MACLGIILARAGSKGLPGKCMVDLIGKPLIQYTFDHAASCRRLDALLLTSDSQPAKRLALGQGIYVIDRPSPLANDTATVDAAARHAITQWELDRGLAVDVAVLLYANIPLRAPGLLDRAIEHLKNTSADSVRSVAPIGKHHPDWLHRLDGDRMAQYRTNSIYRRQDLEPLYYHDGAAVVVRRKALFDAVEQPDDCQAFLGADRRAIIQSPEDAVDIDEPTDLLIAQALLSRKRGHAHVR